MLFILLYIYILQVVYIDLIKNKKNIEIESNKISDQKTFVINISVV